MIKESVDLLCSERDEPSWEEVLGRVRKYANLRRIDLTLRKRNDMHVDETRGMNGRWSDWTRPGTHQGKGPGPWSKGGWDFPAGQNYETPGYAFQENTASSDDWGNPEYGNRGGRRYGTGGLQENKSLVHGFRGKVMNPEPATKENEVAERIEEWVADVMRLKIIDKATNNMPDGYFLSAHRRILCGRIKEKC